MIILMSINEYFLNMKNLISNSYFIYFYENDARGALEVETEKHKKDLRRTRAHQLQVGDHVRVQLSQLQPQIRHKLKEGQQKYVNARFSLEVYTIVRVSLVIGF